MKIAGLRCHIAGSASPRADTDLIRYGHEVIRALVSQLWDEGANFLVGVGSEPAVEGDGPAIIFDWTVIELVVRLLQSTGEHSRTKSIGQAVATFATDKTTRQIPQNREEIWHHLRKSGNLLLRFEEPGWHSGAERRRAMARMGDLLFVVSGGEGVEHLAQEYIAQGKPVIPLDLDLGSSSGDGSGGGFRLSADIRAHPERFIRLKQPDLAGSLLQATSTINGATEADELAQSIIKVIEALRSPRAFYIRLLDARHEAFDEVESFFRKVVDPVVEEFGYERKEMGRDLTERAWLNDEIFSGIAHSGLVVADLTGLRPNCLMEFGFALGLEKRFVLAARAGTKLPFDPDKLDCLFWKTDEDPDTRIPAFREYWIRNYGRPSVVPKAEHG